MDFSNFWTLLTLAFVVGTLAVVGYVGYYWFVIAPRRRESASAPPIER
jgi:hypothetical protein